ncbi:hypothetical protein MTBPR1_100057 [Candidatus Terasakiella magnetica]|uniref:Uncharacterized protein n=1 Tax=Candidatus Terasakiella magnetica TaxID=1867952 RepID=A0A1C3RDP7_9PROT|nr:hypothetical protein [Candidatus Terasakiella magnetica]SCA55416.1 hypothetical protein MTBPR1_100057 [Candidatus Terasakiella magnetica]
MRYDDRRIHSYLPSLQPQWIEAVQKHVLDFRKKVPYGTFKSTKEFNWYSELNDARFTHPYALFSAGHAELDLDKARNKSPMLFNRDRHNTFLLTDSGGYQIGSKAWKLKELDTPEQFSFEPLIKKREQVLRWQEAVADLAVVLEVPAWMDGISYDNALRLTQDNLKYYAENATGEVPFLNVLHGSTFEEVVHWFEETKWFNDQGHGVGWCFPGLMSGNFYLALQMILYMHSRKHYPKFLHFLGNGTAQTTAMLYTLKKVIRRTYPERNCVVNITQDASSEFQISGMRGEVYERIKGREDNRASYSPYIIKKDKFESKDLNFIRHDQHYPNVDGPVLSKPKGVVFGDIIAPKKVRPKSYKGESKYNKDGLSDLILIAHNVWTKLNAIEETQDMERTLRRLHYAAARVETKEFAGELKRIMKRRSSHTMGEDLVAVTVGLWKLFYDNYEDTMTFDERMEILDTFQEQAIHLFGKVPKNYLPEAPTEI